MLEKLNKILLCIKVKNITNRIPELSGKTSKKIKKIVRGNDSDYLTVSARKGGLIRGIPKLAKKGY